MEVLRLFLEHCNQLIEVFETVKDEEEARASNSQGCVNQEACATAQKGPGPDSVPTATVIAVHTTGRLSSVDA